MPGRDDRIALHLTFGLAGLPIWDNPEPLPLTYRQYDAGVAACATDPGCGGMMLVGPALVIGVPAAARVAASPTLGPAVMGFGVGFDEGFAGGAPSPFVNSPFNVPRVGPTPFVVGRGVGRATGKAAGFVIRNADKIPGILNRLGF